MMITGHVERTIDKDFEVEHRRFETMEKATRKLQSEAKGYLDSLRAMTAAQTHIAETINAFHGDSAATNSDTTAVGYYLTSVQELDSETVRALDGPFRETVLDPIVRFIGYFDDVNEAIKKRDHKLKDYDSLRHKVRKLTEKPSNDVTKLPRLERELDNAKNVYEHLNHLLTLEIPQLLDMRVPYLDPSFEALVKIQLKFCTESYTRLAQVQQYLDAASREEYATGHLDTRVEQALQGMNELKISALGS
jgi:amphiphysin